MNNKPDDLLPLVGLMNNSRQLDVILYIFEHTNPSNNLYIGTVRATAEAVGVSIKTASVTFMKLQAADIITKKHNGVYMIKGDVRERNRLIIKYKNIKQEQEQVKKCSEEPDFIKVYLDCLLTFKSVRKGLNPILLQFLSYMTYADSESAEGGQLIIINKYVKEMIAKKLGLGIESVNKALTELTKSGIFRRVSSGTYQANPNLFGRGEWKDIKNIRAVFDFAEQNINAEIVRAEDTEDN